MSEVKVTVRQDHRVTVRDIASEALVSIGTVSRVLNNHPNVEPDLRLRVMKAISELGYTLPKRGRTDHDTSLTKGPDIHQEQLQKIKHVAFCCRAGVSSLTSDASNSYVHRMLRGAEAECGQHNLHLIYRIIDDQENELEQVRRMLLESRADALLLINFSSHDLVTGLHQLGLPTVLVDHLFSDLPIDIISSENYQGAVRAVQFLIQKGHRRIGFINGLPHYTIQSRFEGYRRALEEAGIGFDWRLVVPGDLTLEGGIAAAQYLVQKNLDCTAYFCANDPSAFGFIQGLRGQGLQVPQDISVVGFDDLEGAGLISPTLTTVRANTEEVGRMAIRKLLERVNFPDLPVTQTLLYTSLVERESVRSLT
jgi:DNA-binding LacI/PurR family transcriptional regulator